MEEGRKGKRRRRKREEREEGEKGEGRQEERVTTHPPLPRNVLTSKFSTAPNDLYENYPCLRI
jgi:hypothetical protein